MNDAFSTSVSDVLTTLNVDERIGLKSSEANLRISRYGKNEIPPPPPTSFFKLVLKQFQDLMVLILLGAAFVSFILAWFEDSEEQLTAFMEPAVILIILIANAAVGVIQETNAEKAIEKLKDLDASEARVLRDGRVAMIDPSLLVPGDIVHLVNGDKCPADIRLTSLITANLTADEASLTGEPVPVSKHTEPISITDAVDQDKRNICFRSTLITRGKAVGVVVLTGKSTSIGKIEQSLQESADDEQRTPLQEKLDEFGEQLSKIIVIICVLVWVINIGHFTEPEHGGMLKGAIYYFKIAVALAVAAIPEGLPAVVTTCLALGTMKMAKKNAIVRSLPSVETLGCTTVICSDKTGTLTTNKMCVTKMMVFENVNQVSSIDVTENGWSPIGSLSQNGKEIKFPCSIPAMKYCSMVSTLCNDSCLVLDTDENGADTFSKVGESTEAALKVLAEKISVPDQKLQDELLNSKDLRDRLSGVHNYWQADSDILHSLEFHRERKSMSVLVNSKQMGKLLLVKGAPEALIDRCSSIMISNGKTISLKDDSKFYIKKQVESALASNGLRCLALAYVENPKFSEEYYKDFKYYEQIESNLTLCGVIGMLDPPRVEVKESIKICRNANIRVIVITGDNKVTAVEICRMIGVFDRNEDVSDKAFTGSEFFSMNEERQDAIIRNAALFARVEPVHKKRLVDLLQSQGHVVAMTGDGVNDAPALKRADIGIAMGSGTAVAKESSDMVLQDDNFATIVMAICEGRAIYANTKQFIRYMISSNIGEVACIFFTAAIGMPEALIPVQLLWVNLVTDGLPATALGFNKPDDDIMERPPRGRTDKIIDGWMFFRYLFIGLYIGIATVFGFIWWYLYYEDGPQMTYTQLTNFHNCDNIPSDFHGIDCSLFTDPRPSTISLSILVMIEMFNTFNALSENQSLLVIPPWANIWVLLAVVLSLGLHVMICYWPFMSDIFSVSPLNSTEWSCVFALSFPVILLDECLKFVTRKMDKTIRTPSKKEI